MGERTGYPPGTFSWADLGTVDAAAVKAFYAGLFGWEAEDVPAGDAGTYTMLRKDGREVAGMSELSAEMGEQGVPPHWLSYVTVEDVDATVARAEELGGAPVRVRSTSWTPVACRSSATPRAQCSPCGSRSSTRAPPSSTNRAR